MKLFLSYIVTSCISLASISFLSGCSNETATVPPAEVTEPVVFDFNLNQLIKAQSQIAPVADLETECNSETEQAENTPYSFIIKTHHKESNKDIELKGVLGENNDKLKSDPIYLPVGTYTLLDARIYKDGPVLYQAVMPESEFATFVPVQYHLGTSFVVSSFTKPTVSTFLLCTKNHTAKEFGMPKFETQRVETYCFDLFVNVCDPALNDEHFVGNGSVKVYSQEGGNLLWEDEDGFGDGKIATICFADYIDDPNEAYYIEIVLNNSFLGKPVKYAGTVPVSELLKFKALSGWDSSMNALHVELCPGKDKCFFGQYICKISN